MYKYETHLHTYPVSACAKASVEESLMLYKNLGYDGVFITNHFLDGNINIASEKSYEEKIDFYFSDYEKGVEFGKKIGLKVFLGIEISYGGTDFLIYGLNREWFLNNPRIMEMGIKERLAFYRENGAFIIHAHPFRQAWYIDHIRLYPDYIDGVEIVNACRTDRENDMAKLYAENYGFLVTAGTDNHIGKMQELLSGIEADCPITCEQHFISLVKDRKINVFTIKNTLLF